MGRTRKRGELDALLQAYKQAGNRPEAERLLDQLLLVADERVIRPTAAKLLGSSQGAAEDVEDVRVIVKTKLALELRERRADPGQAPIDCLEAYARTMTRHACADLLERHARRREVQEEGEALSDRAPDPRPGPVEEVVMQEFLRCVWEEICRRPPRQRAVLLLDWDEVGHVPQLLQLCGVASMVEIAEALGMSLEELAAVWYYLPLDGAGLARRMGIERQQVYNLRMVACRSLRQRLKGEQGEA